MTDPNPRFELSSNIDHYLATLSKMYAQEGERLKQEIVVNAEVRVHEEWSYDNWNGGTYGHALYLTIPEPLYISIFKNKEAIQKGIKHDLNQLHNVQSEFIEEVFLEMEAVTDRDWRRESGVLHSQGRSVAPSAEQRIWGDSGYRVFLSHKSEVKKETAELKHRLELFGISSFVAHADIHPTREWQDEIENALASMDAFVALLTEKFHESAWTDQEVGYALGCGVPMIAVKLQRDPYGFIGKFQALRSNWNEAPLEIVKILIKQPRMLDAYIGAVRDCTSFDDGNTLSKVFPEIEGLTPRQAEQLMIAFNEDSQLRGSFGFNGAKPSLFGNGLAVHLTRATGETYVVNAQGEIEKRKG
jgi:TIR domain